MEVRETVKTHFTEYSVHRRFWILVDPYSLLNQSQHKPAYIVYINVTNLSLNKKSIVLQTLIRLQRRTLSVTISEGDRNTTWSETYTKSRNTNSFHPKRTVLFSTHLPFPVLWTDKRLREGKLVLLLPKESSWRIIDNLLSLPLGPTVPRLFHL